MARIQDVANFFIDLAQEQARSNIGDPVTNLRLQKLLYFAQGWHLARYGLPLFEDEMCKWPLGPVAETIYHKYRENGNRSIFTDQSIDENAFTAQEYSLLLDVAREYDSITTGKLVDMTHEKGTPWDQANDNGIISKDSIRSFFCANIPLKTSNNLLKRLSVVIPGRDQNGQAVIEGNSEEGWESWNAG